MSINAGIWNVSKYAWWDYGTSKWQVPVDLTDASTLILKGTQLLLVNKKTVVESFNLTQKSEVVDVFVRNGSVALLARRGERYKKFKFLFGTSKDAEDCADCLRKYIKTEVNKPRAAQKLENNQEHKKGQEVQGQGDRIPAERETLTEMLERIMSKAKPSIPAPDCIPEDYPLESAVRLCILDPGFPKLVEKVEAIINNNNR